MLYPSQKSLVTQSSPPVSCTPPFLPVRAQSCSALFYCETDKFATNGRIDQRPNINRNNVVGALAVASPSGVLTEASLLSSWRSVDNFCVGRETTKRLSFSFTTTASEICPTNAFACWW